MEEFTKMLNDIQDSYYDFIVAVLTYVKKEQARFDKVKNFIESNPTVLSSDVLAFISEQNDFYEDAAYVQAQVG